MVRQQVTTDLEQSSWRRDGPRFVLLTWLIATIAVVGTTAGAAILVSIVATVRAALGGERSAERLGEIATEAIGSGTLTWIVVITSQLVLFACAHLACRVLRKPATERLGLVATQLSFGQGAVLLAATIIPFSAGLVAAWLVSRAFGSSSDDAVGLLRMWHEGSRAHSVAWILLIALLPGFAEEVFYRGFLLRGLLLRWSPAASIFTSSLLFAVAHGEPAWAAAIFPLGLWLGGIAWRTGSVAMTFAIHAGMNGLWTAGMMTLHREPAYEPMLNWIAIGLLTLGLVAFPWAIAILWRQKTVEPEAAERRPLRLFPRTAIVAGVAGAFLLMLIPAGGKPAPSPVGTRSAPALAEIEAGAVETAACSALGEVGAIEFSLTPGVGTRIALPENRAGIDELIVTLDGERDIVWLAYAGELSGKGNTRRPLGVVEQLAADHPTVVCITLAPGPPPVKVRLTLDDDQAAKDAHFERAAAEQGWATRSRK